MFAAAAICICFVEIAHPVSSCNRQTTVNGTPTEMFKHSLHQINSSSVTLFAHRFGPDTALNLSDVGLTKQVHTQA